VEVSITIDQASTTYNPFSERVTMIMLRKALTALALVPLVWGAEEFEVLLEDMIEKVCPLCYAFPTHH
jgi:hypothetical protein